MRAALSDEAVLAAGQGAIRVLIAGSTDTGLYTSLLNAAAAAGGAAFARSLSVTLVDQCETPLEICRRYARTNGLQLETVRSDLAGHEPETQFDMIVMHGVLTFFPEADRLGYMRRVAAWLAPQGALVSSVQFGERVGADEPSERIAQALDNLQAFLDEEDVRPGVDKEEMGDLAGLDVLHLQCHFGLDTLSVARQARSVAGVDFIPKV